MESRLNPQASPFYPSTFYYSISFYNPPPPPSPLPSPPPPPPPPYQHVGPPIPATFPVRSTAPCLPAGPRNRLGFTRQSSQRVHSSSGTGRGGGGGYKKFRETIPLRPDEGATTVMIRNIPNNYTRAMLVELLENHCKLENEKDGGSTVGSAFDFVYLPIDFKHKLNAGYAFVNFTSSDAAWRLRESLQGKTWDMFESKKIADVTRARIQGKDALVRNFERMKLCSPSSEYLPVWFEPPRDGCVLSSSSSSAMKMYTIGEVQDR